MHRVPDNDWQTDPITDTRERHSTGMPACKLSELTIRPNYPRYSGLRGGVLRKNDI